MRSLQLMTGLGHGSCLLLGMLLVVVAGCQERIVRDSRFSAFAARYSVREKSPEKVVSAASPSTPGPRDHRLAEYDLSQFAGQPRYSLQIGYWDETYRGDFRQAAEKQVLKLRSDGLQAYLYHGPLRSLVCLGLFDESDLIRRADGSVEYGPRVRALQQRFPYNLANGEPFRLMIFGRQQKDPQPSFLIEMPRPQSMPPPPSGNLP